MSDDQFTGAGGPPPQKGGGGGKRSKKIPKYGFDEPVTYAGRDGKIRNDMKPVFPWRLKPGEKNRPILLLDPKGKRFSVYISGPFTAEDGLFGSLLVSPFRSDPQGDPMIEVLGKEPTWYWVLTGIDLKPFKSEQSGKTYYSRVPVFVTDRQKSTFLTAEKMGQGLRGHVFNVSRDSDSKSYRIGSEWDFVEKWTDEEMAAKFADAAENRGMPLDQFLAPFDYEAMFEAKSYAELEKIAKSLKESATTRENVQLAGEEGGPETDADVPF